MIFGICIYMYEESYQKRLVDDALITNLFA
jgi:hypothetical protein